MERWGGVARGDAGQEVIYRQRFSEAGDCMWIFWICGDGVQGQSRKAGTLPNEARGGRAHGENQHTAGVAAWQSHPKTGGCSMDSLREADSLPHWVVRDG